MPAVVDEFRHEPGPEPHWAEAWHFEVVDPALTWGLYARLTFERTRAWWWSVIVRAGEPMLLVRDQDLDLPRGYEVRGDGLWADLTCHDAMARWQVNFEGFALALDDPLDAFGHERGDRVAVEFEFDWDAIAPATPLEGVNGYGQRGRVSGDAQIIGADALALDHADTGYRTHTWGLCDYAARPWVSCEGAITYGDEIEGLTITPQLAGGLLVDTPDGRTRPLQRAASTITEPDGSTRVGWAEWNLG